MELLPRALCGTFLKRKNPVLGVEIKQWDCALDPSFERLA
jgi:hypothetical protein